MQPFNKYYPPDWTPEKGSINTHYGKHALGDRARKLDQGILIVRFELPFNIWCTGCDNHVGQGVRYNAEKKKIGNYYSTPILQFRMRCHLCSNWIEIHTDPKNTQYVVVSGARKKVEEWDAEDTEVIKLQEPEIKEKLENDPMYRLEHGIADKKTITEATPHLTQLQQLNTSQWADPYTRSQQLRKQFREEKKRDRAAKEETERVRDKHSLQIELLPPTIHDEVEAKSISYASTEQLDKERLKTAVSPLFQQKKEKSAVHHLSHIAKIHTRLKTDPFYSSNPFSRRKEQSVVNTSKKLENMITKPTKKAKPNESDSIVSSLAAYGTDSDSE
ncbi:CWC16 protein [Choanephora cucurbitarum]|nr:CWC16 protein [Choanephora cucurbitarum]